MVQFSWEKYCSSFQPHDPTWFSTVEHESTRQFLIRLNLSSLHPICEDLLRVKSTEADDYGAPLMGPMLVHDHHKTYLDAWVTIAFQLFPALYACGELWLRLFAFLLSPLCLSLLFWDEMSTITRYKGTGRETYLSLFSSPSWSFIFLSCIVSVAAAVVFMTDTYYVLEYGPEYGLGLFIVSCFLSVRALLRHRFTASVCDDGEGAQNNETRSKKKRRLFWSSVGLTYVAFMVMLSSFLVLGNGRAEFGGPIVPSEAIIKEGLYYDEENDHIRKLVSHWPSNSRTYSVETGATPWMPTGDARTGLPFLINRWDDPTFLRVFLPTIDEEEVVALDICFPSGGHDESRAIILVLHGLSGGSQEAYIQDMIHRRTHDGHTVVVMIARGLMDLPIRGWNVFHGARVDDAHAAAMALRRAAVIPSSSTSALSSSKQLLVGVGYSMGGIILANYVARYGSDCYLDAAMPISAALDIRHSLLVGRALRLWQPLLVEELRGKFILEKLGEKYRARLSPEQILQMLRSSHVAAIDKYAISAYNGYDDLMHYYSDLSAMGDLPFLVEDGSVSSHATVPHGDHDDDENVGRIGNVSIPLLLLHALDDPLVPWTCVAAADGLMHPERLVKTGKGNIMMLLTKSGGHVGWPTGWLPHLNKWRWMSDAVKGFVDAVALSKEEAHH